MKFRLFASATFILSMLSLCKMLTPAALPVETPLDQLPADDFAAGTSAAGESSENEATAPQPSPTLAPATAIPATATALPAAATPTLDPADANSVLAWIISALERGDASAFAELIDEDVAYANYIEGGQILTSEQFMADLEARLPSGPRCSGVYQDNNGLHIWTTGWSPAWKITEICYVECAGLDPAWQSSTAGFLLFPKDGVWDLKALYLNFPAAYYFDPSVRLNRCEAPFTTPVAETPEPGGSCPGAPAQRMNVGGRGVICTQEDRVRVREAASRSGVEITRLAPGEYFDILDGPSCADDWSWWYVLMEDGQHGWIAEGGDSSDAYYICPAP